MQIDFLKPPPPPPVPTSLEDGGVSVDRSIADNDSQIRRFSRYLPQRSRILNSLSLIDTTLKGKMRFITCGERARIEYSPQSGRYRLTSRTCGHRWCPACRQAFIRDLREKLHLSIKGSKAFDFKFITLTVKPSYKPLRDEIRHLYQSFRRLRQTTLWQRRSQWGVATLEVTLNPKTKLWHPHLHIITKAAYIPQKALSAAWTKASGGSSILDIRAVKNSTHAISYITKYVSKEAAALQSETPELHTAELLNALKGAKTVLWFGNKPDVKEQEDGPAEDQQKITWIHVCSLTWLLRLTRRGNPNASCVLAAIDAGSRQLPLFEDLYLREAPS